MSIRSPLETCYRGIRRFHVFDLTWLLAASGEQIRSCDHGRSGTGSPDEQTQEAEVVQIDSLQLERLHREGRIDQRAGHYPKRSSPSSFVSACSCHRLHGVEDPQGGDRVLVGLQVEHRVVSFVWVAMAHVRGEDNFSRSRHLGTSLRLPPGVGFLSNAWTDPDHRGRGCLTMLLTHIAAPTFWAPSPMSHWMCTVDWTNAASLGGFAKVGFRRIGRVWRFGRGRWQWSLVPDVQGWWRTETDRQELLRICRETPCSSAVPAVAPDAPGWCWPAQS